MIYKFLFLTTLLFGISCKEKRGIPDSNINELNHYIATAKKVYVSFYKYPNKNDVIILDTIPNDSIDRIKSFISFSKPVLSCTADKLDGVLSFRDNKSTEIYNIGFSLDCPMFYFKSSQDLSYEMTESGKKYLIELEKTVPEILYR